jgi:hypothetical protein
MKSMIKMVWHIFKKDVRLLWPFVLGAAGIQFARAAVRYRLDQVGVADAQALSQLLELLMPASVLAAGLLIATAVHQDALPGVRQDWLVRPVKRKDLLFAKLLFLLVMVHGPILLADMFETMAHGFSPGQVLFSAITRGLLWLGFLTLPALAFAALTRNMTETVVGGVVLFLCNAAPRQFLGHLRLPPTSGTGLEWVARVSVYSLLFLGATVILTMQYFRRKTIFSRWLILAVACLAFLALYIPWQVTFAVEKRLSPTSGADRSILPVYAPTLGRFLLPEGVNRNAVSQGNGGIRYEASTVYVPVHITALPDGGVLNTDRSQVRLLALDGKLLYQGPGDDLLVNKEGHRGPTHFTIGSFGFKRGIKTNDLSVPQDGEAWIYHGIALPPGIYGHIKNQPLRLEIDYSFTLLQGGTYVIPALDGKQVLPGLGRCTTKMDDDGDDVNLHCLKTGSPPPSCVSAFLEHVPSGRGNPGVFGCDPNYAPFLDQINPDGIARFGLGIRFHDLSGLTKYPVEAADLPESRVVVRVYQPQEHFTRQLVIPQIRLSDWESVERKQVADNGSPR